MRGQLIAGIAAVLTSSAAYGNTLALWTFETSQPAATNSTQMSGIAAEGGSGTASAAHASSATDYSSPAGNGSAHSFSANTWADGDFFEFQTSSLGFQNITVEFHQTRSGTGPGTFALAYSTDGVGFSTFGSNYAVAATSWSSVGSPQAPLYSFDLSGISALNNAANIYFTVYDATNATSAAAGTSRIDNVHIQGTAIAPVPLPAAAWTGLALLGGTGLTKLRRRAIAD